MKLRTLAIAASALAMTAAAAPAAGAATITYEGDTLVYADEGGAPDDLIIVEGFDAGNLHFHEYAGNAISYPTDKCYAPDAGGLECAIPAAMRFDLGGGDDEVSLQGDVPTGLAVTMLGGDGNDIFKDDYGVPANRRFDGGAGNDTIEAYQGDDVLLGGPGNDILKGGAGADEVRGGDGDDELEGDKYEDPSADVIDGGAGFDIVEEWSDPEKNVHPPATVTQNGVADDGRPGEGDNVTGIEKITSHVNGTYEGTEGADDIWIWSNMAGGDSTIRGFGGDDKLKSQDYDETIDGGAGNDTIQAGYGNDTVTGGPGRDNINADGGSYCGGYECKVPFGDDMVYARDGEADQVECGIGNDTVEADAVDQVGPSCETVNRPGGSGPGDPGKQPGGEPPATGAPAVTLAGKASVRRGLTFKVDCAGACKVSGTLVRKGRKIGRGSKTLLAAGRATVKVKLSAKARRSLKRVRRTRATLKVTVTDASGTAVTVSRKVTLRR